MTVETFDHRRCALGEGPHYDAGTDRVFWVDILGARVRWRGVGNPDDTGGFDTGAHIGAAVPTTGGGLVLCLPDRLVLRSASGDLTELARLPHHGDPGLRSNDAKADPAGRLWHGTMAYAVTPGAGALYLLPPGGRHPEPVLTDVSIANGVGWSPGGATMYHVDSPTGRVDAYEVDPATGRPGRRRTFATVVAAGSTGPTGAVVPDGLCVDADGGVWVAVWGGGVVHRYLPSGRLERTVTLPTPLVTSCAFAGPELDLLIVTTAADTLTDDAAAGRTYQYRPGDVTGRPCDRYIES